MWIKKAEITSFGKWRQQTFLFEAKNQLVYGLNEAGKSTLYQFIQAILFGFPTKRKKGQDYTPNDGSGFGGRLLIVHPTYGTVTIERYKAKNKGKAKVWLEDGQQGEEDLLEKILYPLNQQLFRQVFTFQQEQLQQLDVLSEENLHEALISLGLSGSNELFEQRIRLKNHYEGIYRPRGRKQPLNQALQNYQALQQRIKEKEAQEAGFQQLVRQADEEKRASPHMQAGICYLRACDPFRFSGEYVKDDAANWFWNLYETGISGGKKVSERMSDSTFGY